MEPTTWWGRVLMRLGTAVAVVIVTAGALIPVVLVGGFIYSGAWRDSTSDCNNPDDYCTAEERSEQAWEEAGLDDLYIPDACAYTSDPEFC